MKKGSTGLGSSIFVYDFGEGGKLTVMQNEKRGRGVLGVVNIRKCRLLSLPICPNLVNNQNFRRREAIRDLETPMMPM